MKLQYPFFCMVLTSEIIQMSLFTVAKSFYCNTYKRKQLHLHQNFLHDHFPAWAVAKFVVKIPVKKELMFYISFKAW